jgi:hypothetical protein
MEQVMGTGLARDADLVQDVLAVSSCNNQPAIRAGFVWIQSKAFKLYEYSLSQILIVNF